MVRHVLKILQQMILHLMKNLESADYLKCVKPFWCQVYLEAVNTNTVETRLWNKQKRILNKKYFY